MLAHCKSSTTNYQFMQLIDQFMLDIRMILSFFGEGARVRAINVSLSNRFSISTRSLFFFSFNSCQSNKKSLSFEISWYFAEKKKIFSLIHATVRIYAVIEQENRNFFPMEP